MTARPGDDPFQFDYRRHLAAQDLLPQHQEDFQRLVKLLRYAPRFQLLFARIADESYRDLLIGKLQDLLEGLDRDSGRKETGGRGFSRSTSPISGPDPAKASTSGAQRLVDDCTDDRGLPERAGRPVHRVDLADDERFPDFAALETWLASVGQGEAVIHLVNTGHWLQGPRLQSLNLRRDALAKRLDAALLWWLPPAALERVAREAPDAWSWRSGVFDFVAAVPQLRTGLASRPEASSDIGPLTLAQRSRRLAVLHQQLDGEGAAAIPDDLRLNLLLEQGDLYKSLGQWDLAQRVLREGALPLAERLGDVRTKAGTQGRIADILQVRGEWDAALRIRTEEELPVFERLGDAREKAVTQGKIAGILEARGELDAALALYDQQLPIAQQMGDIEVIAHIRFSMARIRLQRGDHRTGGLRQVHDDLAESFAILRKLGRPDGIGAVGELLAQVLAMRGQKGEALEVLDQAESAYDRLANDQGVSGVRSLREAIRAGTIADQA